MKKIFVVMLVLCLIFTATACSTKNYEILEIGGYDDIINASHTNDVELKNEYYIDENAPKTANITLYGETYEAEYYQSRKGYFYNDDVDTYMTLVSGKTVIIFKNRNTDNIDALHISHYPYTPNKTDKLSEDQCRKIAIEYCKQYTDIQNYTLVDTYEKDDDGYINYTFYFSRYIGGFETSDQIRVEVTEYGDVYHHDFYCIGEMKDAKSPKEKHTETIKKNINDKVDSIYSTVTDKYEIAYTIDNVLYIKTYDGKYALQYTVKVDFKSKDKAVTDGSETVSFLVYL